MARVIEWQLEHPDGTQEECQAWLKTEHRVGRVRTEDDTTQIGKRGSITGDTSTGKKMKR